MVTAYTPRFTPTSYDGIHADTPLADLPELLERWAERGGFDPRSGQLTPFKNTSDDFDESLINQMLDSLSAAVEAGLGTRDMFLNDFFATDQDILTFAPSSRRPMPRRRTQ